VLLMALMTFGWRLQDMAYYLAPTRNATVTISLCGSHAFADAFDTKCVPGGTRVILHTLV